MNRADNDGVIEKESNTDKESNLKSEDKVETNNAINPLNATNDAPEIKVKESELESLKRQRKAIKMGEDEPSLMPK